MKTSLGEILAARLPKLKEGDYAYFLINEIREHLNTALTEPDVKDDLIRDALADLSNLEKDLKGDG